MRRLPHPRNPRNPRSLLCPSRVGHPSWALRAAAQPSGFVVGSAGPQSTQKDAEMGGAGLRLNPHRVRSPEGAPSLPFPSSPWNRGASRCIGTDGLRKLRDAATPHPLRKRRGLDVLGTGDRGWRPGGLTPGYCLKPFQGFEDRLGNGHRGKSRTDDGRCELVGGGKTGRLQPRCN